MRYNLVRYYAVRYNLRIWCPKGTSTSPEEKLFQLQSDCEKEQPPEAVRDAPTVSSFKCLYRRHMEGTVAHASRNT